MDEEPEVEQERWVSYVITQLDIEERDQALSPELWVGMLPAALLLLTNNLEMGTFSFLSVVFL